MLLLPFPAPALSWEDHALDCSGKMTFLEPSQEDDGEKLRVCFMSGIISSGEVSKALMKLLHVFI